MPELTARNIAVMILVAASLAAALAAAVLFARQDNNAPIRIIAPESRPPTTSEVSVYVNGAVLNPGVYTIDSDSRIADAIAAAGGMTGEANREGLNLALRVKDEAEYYIPMLGEPPSVVASFQPAQIQPGGLIDLNLASEELLDTLPGIGPELAKAIISYRENIRAFQSIEEIEEVPKIGPITYQKIRDLITVSGVR